MAEKPLAAAGSWHLIHRDALLVWTCKVQMQICFTAAGATKWRGIDLELLNQSGIFMTKVL